MYHLAMRFLANRHDSEDVLIIAFTKVFDKISCFEYRGENSLKKWIKTIVINESIRFLDQRKELQLVEDHLVLERELPIENEALAIDTEEVYSIIENMPVGYRTVFNLYAIEGYKHKEIAKKLEIDVNTSKSQYSRAKKQIQEKLGELKKVTGLMSDDVKG